MDNVVNEYFENGIRITVLSGFTERQPIRSHKPKVISKPYKNPEAINSIFNQKFIEWHKVNYKRLKMLPDNSLMSLSWFEQRLYGYRIITKKEFNTIIEPAMKAVEKVENFNNE